MADVPGHVTGLDFDPVKVGRPVSQAVAMTELNFFRHLMQWRRLQGLSVIYQIGDSEVNTPTRGVSGSIPNHQWNIHTTYSARKLRGHVVTLGGPELKQAQLRLDTTTAAAKNLARPVGAADPGAASTTEMPTTQLEQFTAEIDISQNADEVIELDQNGAATHNARILSFVALELPNSDTVSGDNGYVDEVAAFAAGTKIIEGASVTADYTALQNNVQVGRRYHKKLLAQDAKRADITSATITDLCTRGTSLTENLLDIYPNAVLPERSFVPIELRVLAVASGANTGTVRFAFAAGNVDMTITNTLQWYTTNNVNRCAKVQDTLAVGAADSAGTITVYGWKVFCMVEVS